MKETLLVVFSLNNELCGVDVSQVQEIISYQEASTVPDMPDFVEGIVNLRGSVVPIVNLNKRFGNGEKKADDNTKIVITGAEGKKVGFIVNDVAEIVKFTEEEIETSPSILSMSGSSYLKGIGKKDNALISILDMENILNKDEIDKLV